VLKVFFGTVDEALSELAGYRGPVGSGWGPCPRCRPAGTAFSGVTGDSRPQAARRREPAGQADDVFREIEVECLLKESRQTRRNSSFPV
jgi:hypothetical protein